jgi:putative NADH-flavin reductase
MKLLVLGATGATGRELLVQALRAGHEVTAFVRNPAALDEPESRVRVISGDATSTVDLAAALPGHDAVLSALGSGNSIRSDIASRAATALTEAARQTGVRRLVFLSAFGVGGSLAEGSVVQRMLYGTVMRSLFADKAVADEVIRASPLDWTLVYPVALTHGPATGAYRSADRLPMKGLPRMSRADVADFMLTAATGTEWIRRTAVLGSPR